MKKLYKTLTFLSVILTAYNSSFGQVTPAPLTFNYIAPGGPQTYTVPAGVASLTITAIGAKGGLNGDSTSHANVGGAGGQTKGTFTVAAGQVLNVFVGGRGANGVTGSGTTAFTSGGFNGGGRGGYVSLSVSGGGGGGASDVRLTGAALTDRIIVGGGGGGAGSACGTQKEKGGGGGGNTPSVVGETGNSGCASLGTSSGGGGATATAGGSGGTGGPCTVCTGGAGTLGVGGGGSSASTGGGGGGGYYGGGGGQFTGGGGGSDYVAPTATGTSFLRGANTTGDGLVIIQPTCITQTITATKTTICPYETLTVSDNVSGGAWSSSNTSIATVNPATGVVSGVFPGTTSVATVLITYTAGPCALAIPITVNPLPAAITGSKSICAGLTSALSDATIGGTWSSTGTPSVDVTGVLSGATAGTGTVTYTAPVTGCYITAPTTVNPLPSAITGTFEACVGLSQTLTDATPGGTFSDVNGSLTSVSGNTVTGMISGVDTIIYTLTATGCVATHEFTVDPLPSSISGGTSLCNGATLTLSDGTSGGTWSASGAAATINSATGQVNGIAAGTATITYKISPTGCITTMVVTVNPLPAIFPISPNDHYCDGLPGIDVSGTNSQAGFQYDLYDGATFVATATGAGGPVDFGLQLAGNYTIIATDNNFSTKCTSTMSGVAVITKDPLPNAISGASGVCSGSSIILSDAGGGTWNSSDPGIATINSSGVVSGLPAIRGTSVITYTLPVTGCIMTKTISVSPNYPIYGTLADCNGSVLNLFDTSDFSSGGGTWSGVGDIVFGAGSTATAIKSGPGTGTVTYISAFGCTATTTVTFNPLQASTGPVPPVVCEGLTIALSNINAGGTWSSADAGIATVDASGNVNGVSSAISGGITTISYTLSTGCTAVTTITVNPTPPPIMGGDSVCIGLTTTLSDALTGGTWSTACPINFTIDVGTGVVTGISAGACSISYTMPVTGCLASTTFTVNPLPDPIVGNTTLCEGFGSQLSDASAGGTWTSSNLSVATAGLTTGVLTGVSKGTASITYTLPTGCIAITTATVNATPAIPVIISGKDTLCGGSSIVLTDATAGGSWGTFSSGVISTAAPTGIVTAMSIGGIDSVIYTSAEGCKSRLPIYVRQLSPISGTNKMCIGQTIAFAELATGGTWSSSNPAIGSVDVIGNVTARTAGSIIIKDTFSNGCYATIPVTVYDTPAVITGTPLIICNNSTSTLSDATPLGAWSSTGDAIVDPVTGVVTGANPLGGTATITYTITLSGCMATAVVSVLPLDTIHGPASICYGDVVTLSDGTAGGTWSSTDITIATIGASTGIVSAGSKNPPGGVVDISYTTAAGCVATKSFTVNATGTITPGRVCVGSTVTLSDEVSPGTWSSTSTSITLASGTGVVTGTTAGTAAITYTVGATGCTTKILFVIDSLPEPITGSQEICKGTNTTLSDADLFGTWSSAPSAVVAIDPATGVATGVSPGTSVITYKFTLTGCLVTASLVVDDVRPVAGTESVCVGQTTSLSNLITGGTWSNSCTELSVAGTGVVSGMAAGTCTVTYTNPKGCTSLATVTVSPLPGVITGAPFVVCRGQTITITDAVTGGTWSSTGGVSVTGSGNSAIVTGTATGTGTVTYTSGAGCFVTQTVTVNALSPIVTAPFRVCIGGTITLSDATPGGTWSRSTAAININPATGVVTTNTIGTSTVTYTISSTGCKATQIVTVNPLPGSIVGASVVCAGSQITLTDPTPGGGWTSSGDVSVIGSGTSGAVTGVAAGTGSVTYTLPTGCDATYTVSVNPVPAPITGVNIICVGVGNTTTLSDATPGGTWSSLSVSIGTMSPTSGVVTSTGVVGITTISYTLTSTGCAATIIVSVNPFPAVIRGPSAVCVNSSITLSDAVSGGTWTSSDPSVAAITTPGAVVTGIAAGTAVIDYESPSNCSAFYTVTVLPQPSALITPLGDTNICAGSFVVLTASTGASLSYQWYDAAGPVILPGAITSSYIASPPATTSYQVRVTNTATGCSDISRPMQVSTTPASASITFSPATMACAGTVITLTASGLSPTGYQWESGGVPVPGATARTYVPTVSGSYDAVVTNATGCSAKSSPVTITLNPAPAGTITITGPATFCDGDSVLLSADAGTGYTYSWSNAAGVIPGATNISYYAKTTETYKVSVTNSFGCNTVSGTIGVTVNPLPAGSALLPVTLEFCTGGSVTLSATSPVPGATFAWYENGLPTGAAGNTFLVTTSGKFKALVTDPVTGCSAFTPEDVTTLITKPVILPVSSASFCWGGNATLKATTVAGITPLYQWFLAGVPITGATSSLYPATKGGDYTVTITSACALTSLPVTVKENPLPNPRVTFDGLKIATANYFISYQWYKDLVIIPGATKYNVMPSTNGKYKVAVTDTNGCQSISDDYVLTGWVQHISGVQTVAQGEIKVYPNPAQNTVHIASANELDAVITSIDGRVLIQQPKARDIDIKTLANGIYTIMLYNANGQMVKAEKLVKAAE